jgi:ankyrin repeat protein
MLTTGMTPLLLAAKTFGAEAMRLLLAAGANFNLPNQDGVLPIMAAAGLGSSSCDPRGYGGGIPHYETADVQAASIRALAVLIEFGADVNATGPVVSGPGSRFGGRRAGQTALEGAIGWGWQDVVRYLVDQGARIERSMLGGGGGGRGRGGDNGVSGDMTALLRELCTGQPGCSL